MHTVTIVWIFLTIILAVATSTERVLICIIFYTALLPIAMIIATRSSQRGEMVTT